MVTLRFSDGTTVDYNGAERVAPYGDGGFRLERDLGDGKLYWYAVVPRGANIIIEGTPPCEVHTRGEGLKSKIARVLAAVEGHERISWQEAEALTALKLALRDNFHAQRKDWK